MTDLHRLRYRIADMPFDIYTLCVPRIKTLLPSYEPFAEELSHSVEPLFSLYLAQEVQSPDNQQVPIERGEYLGLYSELYGQGGKYWVFLSQDIDPKGIWVSTTDNWQTVQTTLLGQEQYEALYIKALLITALCVRGLPLGLIKLHASVVVYRGQALALLGRSGTGKSTHAKLWLDYIPEAKLLNDDEPLLRLYPDGKLRIYGAPWSGDKPCYKNQCATLRAAVQLKQAQHNQLSKCSGIEAIQHLLSATALLRADSGYRQRAYQLVMDIIEHLPIYQLDCLPNEEAVQLAAQLLRSLTKP